MIYRLETAPSQTKDVIHNLQREISRIITDQLKGVYIHGSLALGGFNPDVSDIDLLAVTASPLSIETKRELAKLFLAFSNSRHPIEIHFLNAEQLSDWKHPCHFDFHYSEFWREQYFRDLLTNNHRFLNGIDQDADLAAHITIINYKGICLTGEPIKEVFPPIPQSDYISSIMQDYNDCLENIKEDPIYSTLNLIRAYRYLKEEIITSKHEAGYWGLSAFPEEMHHTIKKVIECYTDTKDANRFDKYELELIKNYVSDSVQKLLGPSHL